MRTSRSRTSRDIPNIWRGRPCVAEFWREPIVRGGQFETMERSARERNVVVEFKDRAKAMACYQSPEYQAARAIRQRYADADFIIIDGVAD
jgi:uncharacterized protein (DUF1330 family)